jgi:hypothetical protein
MAFKLQYKDAFCNGQIFACVLKYNTCLDSKFIIIKPEISYQNAISLLANSLANDAHKIQKHLKKRIYLNVAKYLLFKLIFEDSSIAGYNCEHSAESHLMFRSNRSHQSSNYKKKKN